MGRGRSGIQAKTAMLWREASSSARDGASFEGIAMARALTLAALPAPSLATVRGLTTKIMMTIGASTPSGTERSRLG